MSIYWWPVVIFVTFGALFWVAGRAERNDIRRQRLGQLARALADIEEPDPLPVAGRFPVTYQAAPPFAGAQDRGYEFNTGPLLLLSEQAAAEADLARSARRWISETDWLIEQGEQKIGPVP